MWGDDLMPNPGRGYSMQPDGNQGMWGDELMYPGRMLGQADKSSGCSWVYVGIALAAVAILCMKKS